jgi:hypothetical protein
MDRKDLVKKILELSLELKDAEGVQAMMCITDMENAVKDYEKQLRLYSVSNRFSDDKFVENVCLSYDHSYGLMNKEEQKKVVFDCKEWMRAIKNNEPY